ncbi:hypothetical protein evm_006728 [Chilo suppressalis]|nr:hypothetical protein evm_006728 [Chilo suppressalis]
MKGLFVLLCVFVAAQARSTGVQSNIAPVRLASGNVVPASAKFCGYGANDDGAAGEYLNCAEVDVAVQEDGSVVASADATQFDLGAPLVADGVQYGVLAQVGEENVFVNIASAREWISDVTGIPLESDESDSNESNGDSNESNGDSGEDDTEEDESSGDSEEDESPINVPTAGAQAFPMDGIGRLGHDPPRVPSAD